MSSIGKSIGTSHQRLRLCVVGVACALLAGCAPAPPKPDAARVSQFSGHGYASDERYGVSTTLATWTIGAEGYDVALTVPEKAGRFPLVIYLPGLGETRDAGTIWRNAWAQAGYAVLSIQALVEDAKGWSAPKARTGDFAALARVRYSAKFMSARFDALQTVWRELGRRQAAGEALPGRIDLTRVAIAGYDLGAYTAMALAGETVRDLPQLTMAFPVGAVIALSPYADFSGTTFAERYRSVRGPVLSLTTDIDADAIGMVTSPSVRKAPFEYMPAGDKFLMLLWGVPHFLLGGNDLTHEPVASIIDKPDSGSGARAPGGPETGNRSKSKLPETGRAGADRSAASVDTIVAATTNAIGAAAISGVTTAFLDAYLKTDAVAQEWLEKDAARWLRETGEFKRK